MPTSRRVGTFNVAKGLTISIKFSNYAAGALIERPRSAPQRALGSLSEGAGTAKSRDGRSPPRRSARIDMVCSKTEGGSTGAR